VRKSTSGKYHQARLAPSRAEVKESESSVIAAMETVKEKERKSNIFEKLRKEYKHRLTSDTLSSTQPTVQG